MKVLVIGKGGREHALVRSLKLSPSVTEVLAIPGAPGFDQEALCLPVKLGDRRELKRTIQQKGIDLAVIGPEVPLVEGLADFLRDLGVIVFGPGEKGAQLEGSKIFAKEFLNRAEIPTARHRVVTSVQECMDAAAEFETPYVLKAEGLAAGKGVVLCETLEELKEHAVQFFEAKVLGPAGHRALLEEPLKGWETSLTLVTTGQDYQVMPMTQDHKRLGENQTGPNTGGMGAIGPIPLESSLQSRIQEEILKPTIQQLQSEQIEFRGVLYVGIMVTEHGPKVLEFNVRLGDPEAQVLLPLLDGDWGEVMSAVGQGRMPDLKWKPLSVSCVVLAAENYPQNPVKGVPIEGDVFFETPSSYFLHAGTDKKDNVWITQGGRVLNAVGIGSDLEESLRHAYQQARAVSWPGLQMRKDIGQMFLSGSN